MRRLELIVVSCDARTASGKGVWVGTYLFVPFRRFDPIKVLKVCVCNWKHTTYLYTEQRA